ncbi:hypothetical protein, partial [Bradyrhizobium sp. Ai1a-2]|uniref:hypothetical protein n=1 Tax=Bradyrhizobium sp. Ai1a-2 TaxID=196490 RepID=UPI001AEBC88C
NRRDALTLAKLHRAGELTAVWVPDPEHEAVRASDDSCLLKPFPRSLLEVRVHARIRWLVPLNTPTSRPAEALSGFRVLFQHCCLCGADTPDPPQRSNAELKRMTIRP